MPALFFMLKIIKNDQYNATDVFRCMGFLEHKISETVRKFNSTIVRAAKDASLAYGKASVLTFL